MPAMIARGLLDGLAVAVDVASAALSPGSATPADLPSMAARQRLPRDPSEEIRAFRCTVVGGTAPWMPSKHADRPTFHMSATAAWIVPPGVPRRTDLDLASLRATHVLRLRGIAGLAGDSRATVVGPQIEIEVLGPWIAIAWLGHLGHWPDPAAT